MQATNMGVTLKLKGGEIVHFLLIGKLSRQYGFHPKAKGRVVDTARNGSYASESSHHPY